VARPAPVTRLGRMAVMLVAFGFVSLAAAGGAAASTVSLEGGVLRVSSTPGEVDNEKISLPADPEPREVRVTQTSFGGAVGPKAGSGCAYEIPPNPDVPATYVALRCALPAGGMLPPVQISLGDRSDGIYVDERMHAVVYGGTGSDNINANGDLYGGPGNDSISAKGTRSRVYGGPGDDDIEAGPGRDLIHPGVGRDDIWLANDSRGRTAWKDTQRDSVWSRDGEIDDIHCDSRGPADVLKIDRFDWPSDWATNNLPDHRRRPCKHVFRTAPPLPLPSAIDSPDYEVSEGTQVWVFCPRDGKPICQGTIMLRIAGRKFGPVDFRVGAGRQRAFHITREEFGWDDEDSVPAFITLRVRASGRLVRIHDTMIVPPSPYDSA
jgi:hypothetical protein